MIGSKLEDYRTVKVGSFAWLFLLGFVVTSLISISYIITDLEEKSRKLHS